LQHDCAISLRNLGGVVAAPVIHDDHKRSIIRRYVAEYQLD